VTPAERAIRERDAMWPADDSECPYLPNVINDRRALLKLVDDLRAKLAEVAEECAECGGAGTMEETGASYDPCPACADIRRLLA